MRDFKKFSKRQSILILSLYAIVFIGVIFWWVSDAIRADKENLNVEFTGKIDRVEYDIKQFPFIMICDSSYYIGAGYDTDHQIEAGDSIIKRKGSDIYKLIKCRTHKIIEFRK